MDLYQPLANAWRIYDNSEVAKPVLVAESLLGEFENIKDSDAYARIKDIANEARNAKIGD